MICPKQLTKTLNIAWVAISKKFKQSSFNENIQIL